MPYIRKGRILGRTYRSKGIATATAKLSAQILFKYACFSTRVDNPSYGTQSSLANSTTGTGFEIGIDVPFLNTYRRYRAGYTYAIPSFPAGTTFQIAWQPTPDRISPGYLPEMYFSATDDHSLYINGSKSLWDWEQNLNTLIGAVGANDGAVYTFSIPYSTMSPYFGANLSLVLGMGKELDGTGGSANAKSIPGAPVFKATPP